MRYLLKVEVSGRHGHYTHLTLLIFIYETMLKHINVYRLQIKLSLNSGPDKKLNQLSQKVKVWGEGGSN